MSRWNNTIIVLFFLTQALDGALTYIGVVTFGPSIEANPIVRSLIAAWGEGVALATAKLAAAGCGMILHLAAVHRAIALLTLLCFSAAVLPWAALLFVAQRFW
jgi:hypothetical protein